MDELVWSSGKAQCHWCAILGLFVIGRNSPMTEKDTIERAHLSREKRRWNEVFLSRLSCLVTIFPFFFFFFFSCFFACNSNFWWWTVWSCWETLATNPKRADTSGQLGRCEHLLTASLICPPVLSFQMDDHCIRWQSCGSAPIDMKSQIYAKKHLILLCRRGRGTVRQAEGFATEGGRLGEKLHDSLYFEPQARAGYYHIVTGDQQSLPV